MSSHEEAYESLIAMREEQEEKHRRLNSGFGALEYWDEKKASSSDEKKVLFRKEFAKLLDDTTDTNDTKLKLRDIGWKEHSTCLVYGLDGSYNNHIKKGTFCFDSLKGTDRDVADMLINIKDGGTNRMLFYDDSGDKMFFTTLLVFERTVEGTPKWSTKSGNKYIQSRQRTEAKRKAADISQTNNPDKEVVPFVGYDTFTEIESDDISITRWSSMENGTIGYNWLKEEDEAMFVSNIINEGGLRSMFVGKIAEEVNGTSLTFRRAAIVICPVKNIIKLNDAGPNHYMYKNYWVLRAGCRVAPQCIKKDIAHHVMAQVREKATKKQSGSSESIWGYDLKMAMDICMDAKTNELLLELVAILSKEVISLPENEKDLSSLITDALIWLKETNPAQKDKDEINRLAKDRLTHLINSTQNGKPVVKHSQPDAVNEVYEAQVASLDKLKPYFGELISD